MKRFLSATLLLLATPCFAWNNYFENQSPPSVKSPIAINYLLCFSKNMPTLKDCDASVHTVTLMPNERKVIHVPNVPGLNSNAVVISTYSGKISQQYQPFPSCVAGTTNATINFVVNPAHHVIECND